jgi:hypothetical protein
MLPSIPPNPRAGTGSTAGIVDLLYSHHTPAESASALLSLRTLLITAENDSSLAAYRVLSATLVPGQRADFVVAAPAPDSIDLAAAELIRIVVNDQGVHEVRPSAGAAAGPGRRLLVAPSAASAKAGSLRGVVYDVAAPYCGEQLGPWCGTVGREWTTPAVPGRSLRKFGTPRRVGGIRHPPLRGFPWPCRLRLRHLRQCRRLPADLPRRPHLRRQRQGVPEPLRRHPGGHHRALHRPDLRRHLFK